MKTIKVFIASSEELKEEREILGNVVHTMNRSLKPRGVEVELVEWEFLDASMGSKSKQEEYNKELLSCDVVMVLCWQRFGKYTRWEFETAFEGHCAGNKPKKIFIYYKQPGHDSEELNLFKKEIDEYGHFPTKFNHTDTLKLSFVQQMFAYALAQETEMLKVHNSKVELDGMELVDLRNVPSAGDNEHYKSLMKDIESLEEEIADFLEDVESYEEDLKDDPEDEKTQRRLKKAKARLREARQELYEKRQALDELGENILDTNLKIAKLSGQKASVRLKHAIALIEEGDYKGANAVLNFDEIKAEMEQNARRIDHARELEKSAMEALMSNIKECKLKVKTLQTEKSEGWLQQCMDIYEDVLEKAEGRITDEELTAIRFDYALLLQDNNQFQRSVDLYEQNVDLYHELAKKNPEAYLPDVALSVGNLAMLHYSLHRYEESERENVEAISIYRELAEKNPEAYLPDVARNVGNLALLHSDLHRYEESEREYGEAISIYRELASSSPEAYLPYVALNVGNLASLHRVLHHYEESEREYVEAISTYRELASSSPEAYLPKVALSVGNLANLHNILGRYEESEREYVEAISIYRELASSSPEAYLPNVARNVGNLAVLHSDLGRYEESEREYGEAISIYRELASSSPEAYLPDVACYVGNLAGLHSDLRRYGESKSEYGEALGIYRELANNCPKVYLPNVAWILNELAYWYFYQGDNNQALATIEEALEIEPENPQYADSKGEILLAMGRTKEAVELYHVILELDSEFFNYTESELQKGLQERGLL